MKLPFILKWNEAKEEWHLRSVLDGSFVYELRDCANMRRLFDNPDRSKEKLITIDVQPWTKGDNFGRR